MEADPAVDDMLNRNPLILFSVYTHMQAQAVREQGAAVLALIESGVSRDPDTDGRRIDGTAMNRGYGLYWLWVLGAYEVVRTMCQAETRRRCFSPRIAAELADLKKKLEKVRMPFAKLELKGKRGGKRVPVHAELSIVGFGKTEPDMMFTIDGERVSARDLIGEFGRVFSGITKSDVLADHRQVY